MAYKIKKNPTYFDATVIAIFLITIVLIIGYFVQVFIHSGTRRSIAGLEEPKQTDVSGGEVTMKKGGYDITITFKCSYDIDALVVHTKDYSGDDNMGDVISPVDLALAWGKVAEYNEKIDFHWEQHNRRAVCSGLTDREMEYFEDIDELTRSFSNNHMIPAEKAVEKQLKRIRRGDHVRIRGYLVNVDGYNSKINGGSYWYSSTTRDDTGDGACEIIYVTNIDVYDD